MKNKFLQRLDDALNKKKESGFFDLPTSTTCKDSEHNPPEYLHIPQGKGYRHVCPACGYVTNVIPPQILF
jgi:hypothetical protein